MKISVIGIGRVGSTVAFSIVVKGLADELVLINRRKEIAEADALDLAHASAFADHWMTIRAGDVRDSADSNLLIIAASVPFTKNIGSRGELAAGNAGMLRELLPPLVEASPNAILMVITNPVDVMTYLALKLSGFPASRVLGVGTLVDSGRFRAGLSRHTRIHPDDIRAYILGEHGETQFPALSLAVAGGEPIPENETVERLFEETIRGGYEVVRRKGHTNYAIALATSLVIESIVHNERRTIPVSLLVDGYQGVHNVCLSVPAVLGNSGVVRQLAPPLSPSEADAFRRSAATVRGMIDRCNAT